MSNISRTKAVRDSSGAIVSADPESYKQAKMRKKRAQEQEKYNEKVEFLENRINNLENKLDKILNKLGD